MLEITGIEKGIVIDHITQGLGYKIFKELKLHTASYKTALILNVSSNKLGKKDILKIDGVTNLKLDVLGLIDPNVTITIIENDQVLEKRKIQLPQKVVGILSCHNPRCVTTIESVEDVTFLLVNATTKEYSCEFCHTRTKL